jgi:hypothetical protein
VVDDGAADVTATEKPKRDPEAPVFFVSYARPRRPARKTRRRYKLDEPATELFADLCTHVGQLVPQSPGHDVGYMDLTMEGGELWEPELLHAVGTCSVFVALLSDPFLASEWCAMEWDAFSARTTLTRPGGQCTRATAILPVLWTPLTTPMPRTVKKVQRFHPVDVADHMLHEYEQNGLYGLGQLNPKDIYDVIVWKLALRIQHLQSALFTKRQVPNDTTDLRRSFLEDSDG